MCMEIEVGQGAVRKPSSIVPITPRLPLTQECHPAKPPAVCVTSPGTDPLPLQDVTIKTLELMEK